MTCIIGITDGTTVTIGADSLASSGHVCVSRSDAKVFRNKDFLIGFTSSYRMGQILRYDWTPPSHPDDMDLFGFMVTRVISSIRDVLKEQGFASKHNETEQGGSFLVGYRGRLFVIDSDYQVGENACGFASVGSGEQVALGAMGALDGTGLSHNDRVQRALKIAARFTTTVGGSSSVESV